MAATKTKNTLPTLDWGTMRSDWLSKNLADGGSPYTLKMLAVQYGANYGTVKNQASKDGWRQSLVEALDERDRRVNDEVMDRSVWDITEVRWRQARMARVAMAKAMQTLSALKQGDLSHRDAIALLGLGLEQERRALGIATMTKVEHEKPPEDHYQSVEDRMKQIKEYRDLADKFSEFVGERVRRDRADAASDEHPE